MMGGKAGDGFAGRAAEIAALRGAVAYLAEGHGGVAWIEGDPGIGKSALVRQALMDAATAGCTLYATAADPLRQGFPLAAMRDCLRVDRGASDPVRAEIVRLLRADREDGLVPAGNVVMAASDLMCDLVDRECAARPVIVILDDLQWADEASVAVWHRLVRSASSAPLFVVGVARALPRSWVVAYARGSAKDTNGSTWLELGPLPDDDVLTLITTLLGAPPGPGLLRLAAQAAGSPLYVRELLDALRRDGRLQVLDGVVEVTSPDAERPSQPSSLAAAIEDRLAFLSERTLESLRHAALLGERFSVTDIAVVQGCAVRDLVGVIREAVAAGVLTASGVDLAFRHALIREALVDGLPAGLRAALHREGARALAEANAPRDKVAAQLLAAASLTEESAADAWTVSWVAAEVPTLVVRAPQLAVKLLERALPAAVGADWEVLAEASARVQLLLGHYDAARVTARRLLEATGDQQRRVRVTVTLSYASLRSGKNGEAAALVDAALADQATPPLWHARLMALRALLILSDRRRGDAAAVAEAALAEATETGDPFAGGQALFVLSTAFLRAGDDDKALAAADQALALIGEDPELADMRLLLLGSRLTLLSQLGRDIQDDARSMRSLAERQGGTWVGGVRRTIGRHLFLAGQWESALAELRPLFEPGFEAGLEDLAEAHGLAALIAAHRDDRAALDAHLGAFDRFAGPRVAGSECHIYGARAHAVWAEREGRPAEAASVLAWLAEPGQLALTAERGDWSSLPDLVRLSVLTGDDDAARNAVDSCAAHAAGTAGSAAARRATAAASRCRGIADGDPGPIEEAVAVYRAMTGPLPLGHALEDLAVARGMRGDLVGARAALREAVDLYTALEARWDIMRADARTRDQGVRRRRSGTRRPASGWDALTPTEVTVANLVAEGLTNPEIGDRMFLSFRTVRCHVSSIMGKLGVHSRVEIAGEAIRVRAAADAPDAGQDAPDAGQVSDTRGAPPLHTLGTGSRH